MLVNGSLLSLLNLYVVLLNSAELISNFNRHNNSVSWKCVSYHMINSYVSVLQLSAKPDFANKLDNTEAIANLYSQSLNHIVQLLRGIADCSIHYKSCLAISYPGFIMILWDYFRIIVVYLHLLILSTRILKI
jgi:hypothetical protein